MDGLEDRGFDRDAPDSVPDVTAFVPPSHATFFSGGAADAATGGVGSSDFEFGGDFGLGEWAKLVDEAEETVEMALEPALILVAVWLLLASVFVGEVGYVGTGVVLESVVEDAVDAFFPCLALGLDGVVRES